MKRRKVFIATTTFGEDDPSIFNFLKQVGIDPTINPYRRRLTEAEIGEFLVNGGYSGLLAGLEPLTEKVLTATKSLEVISRVGVGLDNVDLGAAKSRGIKVFNTPGVLTDAVAELALGLMLAALRNIAFLDRKMHGGNWEKSMGSLLKGKVVGIIGFGNIGQRVAELVTAFGAKVMFNDVCKLSKTTAQQVTFDRLIKAADIISLHSSGKDCLIRDKEIVAMKPGVILVNTARGVLIDEASLLKGLASGKVACAALDVFRDEPYKGELLQREDVILTPHIGSYAREARVLMEKMAVENLVKGLQEARNSKL